ncbi:arylsulfate sulfotransferase [Salmonella enterica subsp. enterica]|uniref:Arylsulfate sulfotransferase n=1 Tax=Salmonella enterica I TaxID=59201 RepID=A0A379VZ98_SALET|nr:arylsulfate sulfotransferase [Salmonella enterica subsp. enterica]
MAHYPWGYGQRYVKYDIMGVKSLTAGLPDNYNDFSHSMDNAANGHYFLRVASSNYKRPDGKNVRTVRDVIAEVDQNGVVVDEWRLFDILDPYRDVIMKTLDQGAVCPEYRRQPVRPYVERRRSGGAGLLRQIRGYRG